MLAPQAAPVRRTKGLVVSGVLLVSGGLAGMVWLIALMVVRDPNFARMEIAIGLAPAALLSLVFQLSLLVGCRLLFLAWRARSTRRRPPL